MMLRSVQFSRRLFSSKPQQKDAGRALQNAFLRSVKKSDETAGSNSKPTSTVPPTTSSTPDLDLSKLKEVEVDTPTPSSGVATSSTPPIASAPKAIFGADIFEFAPRIKVIGVGGGGCNAVNNMIDRGLTGVDFLACNTDAQHLIGSKTDNRIQIGKNLTQGLGCGANPNDGRAAAMESREEIEAAIDGSHMVFITAGMGGGTGTGAAPMIAEMCVEKNILTVGVVTTPFRFEGRHRYRLAEEGIHLLFDRVDTLIVIPNQNLMKLGGQNTAMLDAFSLANDVLLAGVKNITDLMVRPGLINLDFADVRAIMTNMGNAMMGTGEASGEDRALAAAKDALNNPLIDSSASIRSAKGVLVNIIGGADLTLWEVEEAAAYITGEIEDQNANIIMGSSFEPALEGSIRVSVVATGIEPPIE
mmetsp:Transcript_26011/g.43855  ORF Transcript_26011/g.43855 Transcript_26011/m.43855 type:complete len:417 (-) Transcript_26011:249-1499(-)